MYPESENVWRKLVGQANEVDYVMWHLVRSIRALKEFDDLEDARKLLAEIGRKLDSWVVAKKAEIVQLGGESGDSWRRICFHDLMELHCVSSI